MDMPLCHAANKIVQDAPARFFMPGHKGNNAANLRFGGVLPYDITEIPGLDDLQHPSGPLAQSQANMAKTYGSGATLYSASGSTSCIMAMLTLFVGVNGHVVMARGCHVAAVRALALLDATPHWVLPKDGVPTPAGIESALRQSGAKAVYITSPNYYGQIADIEGIAKVCQTYGASLMVDNAHGAHLHFVKNAMHPLHLGANATADSAHKTLPCLTPAALLHLKDAQLAGQARGALNLYSSTSPSYLVLQSLDAAASLLLHQPPNFDETAERLARAAASSEHLLAPCDDPLKLCLLPAAGGWPFPAFYNALTAAGVIPELADGVHIVLMASPYNKEEDFNRLAAVLRRFPKRAPLPVPKTPLALPKVACSIRSAVFGAKQHVPVGQAVGRIAAGLAAPCPPGIPVVVPGEVISQDMPALLEAGGILGLDVLK